ncbi:MAG: aldolase/citrate lyase family protein [Oscillospiraceae bacterium]|nr:aldolase/citrate lyase family protein [Oscillospiraceae bacterium]
MLKLMYITNDPAVARIAVDAGVDRIFIDMEVLGKAERQGGMDTVQSHHVPADIVAVRSAISDRAEIMARVNPLNPDSQAEINAAVANGADVVMLPMWRTADDLCQLVRMVNGRAKVMPLLETDTAADNLQEAVKVSGIDQMLIGLNDLHLCYHRKFLFQLLTDGTVDRLCTQLRAAGLPFGFGGVGRPGSGRSRQNLSSVSITVSVRSMSFCPAAFAIRARSQIWMTFGVFLRRVWRMFVVWSASALPGRRSSLMKTTAGCVPAWRQL